MSLLETSTPAESTAVRPLHEIAREIRREWRPVYFGAVPYLQAMAELEDARSNYGADSAQSIVLYFLSNARTWRGPIAKRVKAELKRAIGAK